MGELRAITRRIRELNRETIAALYDVFSGYYDAISPHVFEKDLSEKDYVVLLLDGNERVRGFSTVAVYQMEFEGEIRRAIFSGDTIIHHDYWGEQALPFAWCRLAGEIKSQDPLTPLYWFLIVKGHKTYRYLPLFSKRFYPSWRAETPPELQRFMDFLGQMKFGNAYDSQTGLIRFPSSRGHLKSEWASIREVYREKPDIQFFLNKNPNYHQGHELLCLTELTPENMRSVAKRAFEQGMGDSLATLPIAKASHDRILAAIY